MTNVFESRLLLVAHFKTVFFIPLIDKLPPPLPFTPDISTAMYKPKGFTVPLNPISYFKLLIYPTHTVYMHHWYLGNILLVSTYC